MMSILPRAYTGYTAPLELLAHHWSSRRRTKAGPSKVAPVVSHCNTAVSHNRPSGCDLDQIVAQLMWFLRGQSGTFHSAARDFEPARNWHDSDQLAKGQSMITLPGTSDIDLLGYGQGVVDFDTEVAHRALDLLIS